VGPQASASVGRADPIMGHIRAEGQRCERVTGASDGVFASAITLLVLGIAVPLTAEQDRSARSAPRGRPTSRT
jgi:hypothetical protein